MKNRAFRLLVAALLLVCMFGLAVGTALDKSPTFDEGFYIARGWAFLRTGHLLPLGHPPLTNLLSGLGVLLEPELPDPTTLRGWADNDAEAFSRDLLWQRGVKVERVVFLARLPLIGLGLLLGALIGRWGRERYGPWSGALALTLYAFSPNVLAHTSLATTDLGVAAFYVATLYAWSRYIQRRKLRWLVASGVLFGLAQASKFSALFLIPTLAIMTLWHVAKTIARARSRTGNSSQAEGQTRGLSPLSSSSASPLSLLLALLIIGAIGLVTLWAGYLFGLQPYPLSGYVAELQHFFGIAAEGHRAYLLGRFSQTGWWYYHPLVLALKMPLSTLALLALAIILAVGSGMNKHEWEIAFPALLYLGFTMLGSLNVGIRYLLPLLPLLFLFTSRLVTSPTHPGWFRIGVVTPLVLSLMAASLWRYPNYLAFFNLAVGGPSQGYRRLSDSNVDWGQDLPGLARYLAARGAGTVYFSAFGQADPTYYGINYIPLPGWPPPPPDPNRPPFYPLNPTPGLYAISASNLVGVQLYEPDTFAYFLAREPVAQIGYSILIYEVPPPKARPGNWLAQCAVPNPLESEETIAKLTGLDNLRHIYFDCRQSLPFPSGAGWLMLPPDIEPVFDLGAPDYVARLPDGSPRYRVWLIDVAPDAPASTVEFPPVVLPLPIAGHVDLLGYQVSAGELSPGQNLILTAWWVVREPPPPPVSIFAHLLAADGSLIQAGDGLGIAAEDWQPGMVLIQQHRFLIPEGTPPGSYTLTVGLYSLSTGQRFTVSQVGERVVDRIVLRSIAITE